MKTIKATQPRERYGDYEVYKLGFGTRTWCVRRIGGPRGATNHGSKAKAIAYAKAQKK